MDTFGEYVRYQRSKLHLTRKQLADHVGCSIAMLRKIENGERRPSEQIAALIANSLNIPFEERSTFVRVARGELNVDRLSGESKQVAGSQASKISLPVFPTPLIGRQREVEELSNLLRDPQYRLLTLFGPGGIGKTRLAIAIASKVHDAFKDGVYFVSLASVNKPQFIVPVIAEAIGFAFHVQGYADPKTQLFHYLEEKEVLLLVDNFEQLLLESGIELLVDLLGTAPSLKILATSREYLDVQSEWSFEVRGLPIPDNDSFESKGQNTSVVLFLRCARQAHLGFNATTEDYPTIIRICKLVEGNPLAIQLAAGWVRSLSCSEISQDIEHGLDFLSTSMRDLPVRHRSMRAVFDHSWKLLSKGEQESLIRLSVFQGGFNRGAAEQVAGVTLSVLSGLLAKSMLQRISVRRYDLHSLVRQFASEYLAEYPDEQAKIQALHGQYYLTLFRDADEPLRSSTQVETLNMLVSEMGNFRIAWNWAIMHSEYPLLEQTLDTFAMLFDMRAWLQEGLDMLGYAVIALEAINTQSKLDQASQVALAHLLAVRALLSSRKGEYQQAQAMLERSLEILRPLNELRVLVAAVTFLGMVVESTGNPSRALEVYSEGLEIAEKNGDRWFSALCFTAITALTGFIQRTVEPEITYRRFQSVVADWHSIGDPRLTAIALNNFSLSAQIIGRYDEASKALEESIALSMSVGDRWGLGFAYRGLGLIAQAKGQHLIAVEKLRASWEILAELGARQDAARILAEMGRSLFALGNEAEAQRAWLDAIRIGMDTKGTYIVLEALLGIASIQAMRRNTAFALELLWFVLNHPAAIEETKIRANQLSFELETQLTKRQVDAAHKRAKARTIEATAEEILNQIRFA